MIGQKKYTKDKKNRGMNINNRYQMHRSILLRMSMFTMLLLLSTYGFTSDVTLPKYLVSADFAEKMSKFPVQDYKGRMKPMHTLTRELMRKLARKETLYGLNADQIVLSMAANPRDWYTVPLVKLGMHETVKNLIPHNGQLVSYGDFFDEKGAYKLRDLAREAYNKEPRDRSVLDKEIMKIDERLNICSMIFLGTIFKLFPIPNDPNQLWASPADDAQHGHQHNHDAHSQVKYAQRFYPPFLRALQSGMQNGNYAQAEQMLTELKQYQNQEGYAVYPSSSKISAEILLNKLNVFGRLSGFYALLGLAFLAYVFTSVFKPTVRLEKAVRITNYVFWAAVCFHAIGLGLRWYVSGRAPWSNGYESMVYIGFTTVLAGLIFSRNRPGPLAATTVLAATILMVAGLSWLDPEITPLVPVLKSYWLMIHVSLEAGSYGFLVLGAIISVINLIFIVFSHEKNKTSVYRMVSEMSMISEMTVTAGLVMLSVGTYLGGVWANESWGRYWGWDAKETWALVSILVYAFILHMRFIPGLRGVFAYNVATLFGWASIMMTYFGVNYYLSGLHSYAAGDPVPIPDFVYYTVGALIVIGLLAYWKHRKHQKGPKPNSATMKAVRIARA
jgi:cytochrome c-type biogenesis protein CcsB